MTERTRSTGGALRFLATCTVALAVVMAVVMVPAVRATAVDPIYEFVWESAQGAGGPAGAYVGVNPAQKIRAYVPATGLRLVPQAGGQTWEFGLALSAYGYAGDLQPVGTATVDVVDNRVTLNRTAGPTEWYVNTPSGVEQWFGLNAAPAGQGGALVLELALTGGLVTELSGNGDVLQVRTQDGLGGVRYNVWNVTSAAGKPLSANIALLNNAQGVATALQITIDATTSDYPVAIGMAAGSPKTLALHATSDNVANPIDGGGNQAMAASANDECSGAQVIPGAGPFPYLTTTVDILDNTETGDPDPPAGCVFLGDQSRGAWYAFTPTTSGTYGFRNCNTVAPGTTSDDTVLSIFSSSDGTCGGTFSPLACNDDDSTCPSPRQFLSSTGTFMNAGQTYYILAYNWGADPAALGTNVQIQVTKSNSPANDTCAGATDVPFGKVFFGTHVAANNDYSLSGAACFTGVGQTASAAAGRDTVHTFTAPAAGLYSFKATATAAATGWNLVLYTSPTCPVAGANACAAPIVAANRNIQTVEFRNAEEISCQSLAAGETRYIVVDETAAATSGGAYTVEVTACTPESEPNDTPGTASTAPYSGVCPVTGGVGVAGDVDFYDLGTPPAGTRVFAIVDGVSSPGTGDFQMRVTTSTDTLEFDDDDNGSIWGGLSPNISGRPLTGANAYIRVNHFTASAVAEPYLLYAVTYPPGGDLYGSSASTEDFEGAPDFGNDDLLNPERSYNMFWAGSLFTDDLDVFRVCAMQGDIMTFQIDADPLRNLTPFNPAIFLFSGYADPAGPGQKLGISDAGTTSNNTSGAGSLTAVTPNSPGEIATYRAQYSGDYYPYLNMQPTVIPGSDYLFSATVNCQAGYDQSVDLQVTKTAPATVAAGGLLTYTITITNNGPNVANTANLFEPLPDGVFFEGLTGDGTGGDWNCIAPPPGDVGGFVDCTNFCLLPGGSFTFELTVRVFSCIGDGYVIHNEAYGNTVTSLAGTSSTFAFADVTVTDDGSCDDGDPCTENDTCDSGSCLPGGPTNCDDSDPCTDDSCDSGTGCVNAPNTGNACDDGDACTSSDSCDAGSCVGGGVVDPDDGNPCTDDSCDPGTGVHNDPNTDPCDDGNACTSGDVCGGGSCNPGGVVDPDDGNACTDDSCDPGTGVHNDPNANPCDDGNACTTGDTCGGGSCQSGAPVVCNDGNVCTDEVCNPGTGLCDTTNNTNTCDDGDAGTENDVCSGGTCSGTPVDTCDVDEPNPRTKGYYKGLCNNPHSGDELTAADAACVASLSSTFAGVATVADICAELNPVHPNNDQCNKSEMDLMAMALNICKSKVCGDQGIDSGCGAYGTVSESFAAADAILSDPGRTNATCNEADCLTKEVNNGHALEADSLTLSRVSGGLRLDWSVPVLNDGTGTPSSYRVYRRPVGSMAPFTLIANPTLNQYVDMAGDAGVNYQYEVTPVY